MSSSKTEAICELLAQGKTVKEIEGAGYRRGTVFAAQRHWRKQEAKAAPAPVTTATTVATSPNAAPLGPDIEDDPEILQLKKEIRLAELRRQLAMTNMPPDVPALIAAAKDLGQDRRDGCPHLQDDVCTNWVWESPEDIPGGLGEPVREGKDAWHIRPTPLYCAMCTAGLERRILASAVTDLRNQLGCSCGEKAVVIIPVKCTGCGKQGWAGLASA